MKPTIDPTVVKELQPAVEALEQYGYTLLATEGSGAQLYAEFRKATKSLLLVKDRENWFIDGESAALKSSPARNSQSAAIKDAVAWIQGNNN